MVSPNIGGDTANTSETEDKIIYGSNFEVIGAYKYLTLFCIKEHKSVNIILSSWGVKVL